MLLTQYMLYTKESGFHRSFAFCGDDICAIAENESMEDAIIMAEQEISCLDDLSLEGDIPEDVSDEEDDH